MSTDTTLWGLEPMLSVTDLATYLGVPVATIYDWRSNGLGPVGYRFDKHVKFAVSDVQVWIDTRRESSPGSAGGGELR